MLQSVYYIIDSKYYFLKKTVKILLFSFLIFKINLELTSGKFLHSCGWIPTVLKTWEYDLDISSKSFISLNFVEIVKNPFGKDSGITFSLPPQAIESSNYIKKYQLDNFNLSDEIKNNNALYQRIIEFNYPVKFKNNSNIYFSLKQENLLENML